MRAITSRKDSGESERPRNQGDKSLYLASSRERVSVGGTHSLAHFHFDVLFLAFQQIRKIRNIRFVEISKLNSSKVLFITT